MAKPFHRELACIFRYKKTIEMEILFIKSWCSIIVEVSDYIDPQTESLYLSEFVRYQNQLLSIYKAHFCNRVWIKSVPV